MDLSTNEKIERLNKVLARIENDQGRYMCAVYHKLFGHYAMIFEEIPELARYKPKDRFKIGWPWFNTDQEGMRQRIRVIENTIEDLKALQA